MLTSARILYGNRLSGTIDSSLGVALTQLRVLELSSNALSGSIPESLGSLVNLKSLCVPSISFSSRVLSPHRASQPARR